MAVTPEEQKNARRKAMLLLEHMDRTEKGLSDRLRQAGFSCSIDDFGKGYSSLSLLKRLQRLKSQMNWPFSELQ